MWHCTHSTWECGEFWLHHIVAGLTAKSYRIHVSDRAVSELAGDYDIDAGGEQNEIDQFAQLGIGPAQRRKFGRIEPDTLFPLALNPHSQRDQDEAEEKWRGQPQERQNSDIRILGLAAQCDGQQEEPEDRSRGDDDNTGLADPVVAQMNDRGQPSAVPCFGIVWSHGFAFKLPLPEPPPECLLRPC